MTRYRAEKIAGLKYGEVESFVRRHLLPSDLCRELTEREAFALTVWAWLRLKLGTTSPSTSILLFNMLTDKAAQLMRAAANTYAASWHDSDGALNFIIAELPAIFELLEAGHFDLRIFSLFRKATSARRRIAGIKELA